MRSFIFVLIVINLAVICTAQITFTREWVAGKRSLSKNAAEAQDSSIPIVSVSPLCKTLKPVIEYLLEEEKFRSEVCHRAKFSRKLAETLPFLLVTKDREKGSTMTEDNVMDIQGARD